MIQDIEHFSPELKPERLMNRNVSVNGKIPLSGAKSSQRISTQIPLPKRIPLGVGRRFSKRARIQRFSTSKL